MGTHTVQIIPLKRALLRCLAFSAQAFGAGLGSYSDLVVDDSPAARHNGVRVNYLGTNGYEFEFKGHSLLVDPYFSRVDLLSVAAGSRIQPDISRIADGMRHLASGNVWSSTFSRRNIAPESRVNAELQTSSKLDAILVTHGHFDHLLDVPIIVSKTHTRLIASRSSIDLVRRLPDAGPITKTFDAVTAGDVRRIGPWKIRVLPATHDRLFGKVPFDRHEQRSAGPPQRASDWICGEPLAFLIEINGQRIYIDSGGAPCATAAQSARRSRDLGNGLARFEGTIACCVRTFAAALRSAQSPGQFLPAVEPRFSIWAAHGFPTGATRLRATKPQPFNPARLFSTMDTADAVNPKQPER